MISENPYLRLILFVSLLAIMFLIETFWPARSWLESRKKRIKFSLSLALVNNILMKVLITTPFLFWTSWVSAKGLGISKVLGLSGAFEIISTIIVFDFFDAIKHLWFHRVPFMWRFHRVHHTDRHLDVLTALRYHPGEMVISAVIKGFWLLIWGPSIQAFIAFEIVLNLSSEFHHSNICLGKWDAFFNKIIVTPRYHAIHHTINRERGDQNFTTIFSLWDKVLGSYANPQKVEINLERLGTLQDNHLGLWDILRSPLIRPDSQLQTPHKGTESQKKMISNKLNKAKKLQKENKAVIIDVREENEIEIIGNFEGAQNRPFSAFRASPKKYLNSISTDYQNKIIYVFCKAGLRSEKVCEELKKKNITAINLGGFSDFMS